MALPIPKTVKLFIGGAFPRSESGRALPVHDRRGAVIAHASHASRKDLRDAVEAARAALPKWTGMTPYNRGQVLYRMAEMLDGRRAEFIEAIAAPAPMTTSATGTSGRGARRAGRASRAGGGSAARSTRRRPSSQAITPAAEVSAAVERLVGFAGWADKHAEILGRRAAVAGPYHVFSHPEPIGATAVLAPDAPALLGLVALVAAAMSVGNTVVAVASDCNPLPAIAFAEVLATSDVPGGVVNILTGRRAELVPVIAEHREIRAVSAAELPDDLATTLRLGAAENLKRVTIRPRPALTAWLDHAEEIAPAAIEPLVEIKTVWHPSAV
ncbi:MAG TPA: aldehyde dehydrogenase family protein [Phycisphaerales bacterium]|nr:aldehyde dehydrogenase family protein [Phycisphaerales bacterium]HMP37540.1 aldehyde dehydrogenase family protein [Phycisphaerales bacterium]